MSKPNKTRKTESSPTEYLKTVKPAEKQADCFKLLDMLKTITRHEPKMWGGTIVGFGDYHYKYATGREGDYFRAGFAPRAQNLTIYVMPGYQDFGEELSRLGKHKMGKSCLYIKRLSDIDEGVLFEIITKGYKIMQKLYPE